ncbi:MAG TPA: EamA/RhaT family transporter, partial [Porphyromonadaceae bacterium]|nr:EamA/RhaT family transporter [Porphyromonadaceae bacterium]
MNRRTFQGYLFGIISGIAYGLNPFFAKPMLDCGIDVNTILLFRYLLTAILMAVIMGFCRYSFRIKREQIFVTIVLGICFSLSSFFLFEAYKYISSGVATTIVFLYPIMVAIILLFFKEYPSWQVWFAIVLCLLGVAFFSFEEENTLVNFWGIILSSLSAFSYAVYMVIAEKSSSVRQMPLISLMF